MRAYNRAMLRTLGFVLLSVGALAAQQSVFIKYVGGFRPDSLGVPENPPFVSAASVIYVDDIQTAAPPTKVVGKVADLEMTLQRFIAANWWKNPEPPTLQTISKVIIRFDAAGHEIEHDEESPDSTRKLMRTFEDGRLSSETGESSSKGGPNPQGWLHLTYQGKLLAEIRKGHGDQLENHCLNFKYDASGRLIHYEYREGASDKRLEDVDFKYLADTVEMDETAPNGVITTSQVQKLDVKGRVVDLSYSDLNQGKLKLWYHASFRYDDKDRVVEQVSDERELGEGDDYVPLPGRVVFTYDDAKLTRKEEFYDKGKLAATVIAQLDRDGEELSLHIFDGAGREKKYSYFVPDPVTGKPAQRAGQCAWEVDYDSHGNWIERRLWFTPADGTPRLLLTKYTRSLMYR